MTADEEVRLRLLGGFELLVRNAVVPVAGPAARVVAITALRGRMPRETVAATLWPDTPVARGQSYLRSALWRLRAVAPDLISPAAGMLTLRAGVRTDALALLRWALAVTRDEGAVVSLPEQDGVGQVLLPSWDDVWLDEHREQLRVLVPAALETAAMDRLTNGSTAQALWYALHAHQLDPLRESAVRILVAIHQRQGNHSAALQTYRRYRCLLRAELGVRPTPALDRLIEMSRAPVAAPHG